MNKLNEYIIKLNFKRLVKIYIILFIIFSIMSLGALVFVSRDKINMALKYSKLAESYEKRGTADNLNSRATDFAKSSKDIINVLIVDKVGNIIFKTSNNMIGEKSNISFAKYEGNSKYLKDNINKNTIYKVAEEDSLILNIDYINNHNKISEETDSEVYYEKDIADKNVYVLNYMVNRENGNRLFIIRNVQQIPYAEALIEIIGGIAGLSFILYWIGLAIWIYRDASEKKNNAALWGILVLITNLAGAFIYYIFKQNSKVCNKCGLMQSKDNIFCTQCGNKINDNCSECGHIVGKGERYCSKCGNKIL